MKGKAKKKTCVKGYPCGYSCQSKTRSCRNPLKKQGATYQEYLKIQSERLAKVEEYLDQRKRRGNSTQGVSFSSKNNAQSLMDSLIVSTPKRPTDDMVKRAGEIASLAREQAKKYEDEDDDNPLWDKYSNNAFLWDVMFSDSDNSNSKFIEVTQGGKTQGMAAITENESVIEVDYLATHPDNVDPSNPQRIRGSGTKAMIAIFKYAYEKEKSVKLYPIDSARPFYDKLGMVYSDGWHSMSHSQIKTTLKQLGEI